MKKHTKPKRRRDLEFFDSEVRMLDHANGSAEEAGLA